MDMGWNISLYRQTSDQDSPASEGDPSGVRLATWQADVTGLGWLRELVERSDAIHLSDNGGYPVRYTVRAGAAIPTLLDGPPHARSGWVTGQTDIVSLDRWPESTTIDQAAIEECQPDEWLQVEAWDES